MLHMYHLGGLERERRGLGRRHDRLGQAGDAPGEHAAAAGVELRQHVVEEQQRRRVKEFGLGEDERQHRQTLLSL